MSRRQRAIDGALQPAAPPAQQPHRDEHRATVMLQLGDVFRISARAVWGA